MTKNELLEAYQELKGELKTASRLLREANPERRAWVEERDRFLEKLGEFKEPRE